MICISEKNIFFRLNTFRYQQAFVFPAKQIDSQGAEQGLFSDQLQ